MLLKNLCKNEYQPCTLSQAMQPIPMNPATPPPLAGTASIPLYAITALISGVISFCSGILFASVCNCILQCHEQWRVDRKSSKCTTGVATQQRGGSPEYEEISTPESGSQVDMQLQQNAAYLAVQSSH